jgi:hypothetical protein
MTPAAVHKKEEKARHQLVVFSLQPLELGDDLLAVADQRLHLLPDLLDEHVVLDRHVLKQVPD